ncbi:RNA 2',3'-cyclic phosphodiesterase [Streptomyces sp. NBC_01186]|uniref:RNA 2',3'-cyclic phosphodiesterase n=1 Tax=Streptomyces sp. NBC_01186 TaxID=2903765 RepID=UPI002E117FC9|nr:RNA 2',3'-cyclic phosphodiesterase [Streptomyces sp. NBC_01186]
MRLFAALLPPAEAVGELAHAVGPLRRLPGADELRWSKTENWHLTLAFYGETDDHEAADLRTRLARAAHRAQEFPLRLGGGGRFGDRALWAALTPDSARTALTGLAGAASAAGRRAGLIAPGEERGYRPHLTLARARGTVVDLRPYVTELDRFQGSSWIARELVLVRSVLPDSGVEGEQPRYLPVERWPLGQA